MCHCLWIQLLVGEATVPSIHRLEQVSSEEMVGSLAENLMEALRKNPQVEGKVWQSTVQSLLLHARAQMHFSKQQQQQQQQRSDLIRV